MRERPRGGGGSEIFLTELAKLYDPMQPGSEWQAGSIDFWQDGRLAVEVIIRP